MVKEEKTADLTPLKASEKESSKQTQSIKESYRGGRFEMGRISPVKEPSYIDSDDSFDSEKHETMIIDLTQKKGKNETDMKNILGYLDQASWTNHLSISSFM